MAVEDWITSLEPEDVADAFTDFETLVPRRQDETWATIRSSETVGELCTKTIDRADEIKTEPIPLPTVTEYLAHFDSGFGDEYAERHRERLNRLSVLTVAECLTDEGLYLDAITDYVWTICEQSTWVLPRYTDGIWDARSNDYVRADVGSVAHTLAEVKYVLNSALEAGTQRRITETVTERVIDPFLEASEDELPIDDVVCTCGVLSSGLYLLDDHERLARLLCDGLELLGRFLEKVGADGSLPGGMDQWKRDFRYFVIFGTLFEARVDLERTLFDDVVRDVAQFPLRIEMSPGHLVPFGDSREFNLVAPDVAVYLGKRFDMDRLYYRGLLQLDPEHVSPQRDLAGLIRFLTWCYEEPQIRRFPVPNEQEFLDESEWWVARNDPNDLDGMVVAAKGGRNDEPSNHCDVGSFVVHYGRETFVADPGFSRCGKLDTGERYDWLHRQSSGHSVPLVNGFGQRRTSNDAERRAGTEPAASVVDVASSDGREEFELELNDCYPDEAGVESFRRWFYLERGTPPVFVVQDNYRFSQSDNVVEFVVPSFNPITEDDGALRIGDETQMTVSFDEAFNDCDVERIQAGFDDSRDDFDTFYHRDVWRAIALFETTGETFTVVTTIRPAV